MIKILHLIDCMDHLGGAQEIVVGVAEHTNKDDFSLDIAYLYGKNRYKDRLLEFNTSNFNLSPTKFHLSKIVLRLYKLLKKNKYHIIHLHLEGSTTLGVIIGRLFGVPKIVVTIHALKEQLPYWVYPTFAFLARWVDRFILEDRIALHQLLQLNVKRSKTLHIPIGIDILEESPLNNQFISIRQECNIPPECPLILNIARFHVRKGQDYLLRAMSQVIKEIPDTRLIIVGHGTELNKLKHLAKVLNLERHVMFLVNRSDLSNFFIASDLFVNSTLDEGMGVVIYQAMTCDKAVVAFNAGSINEVVVNGETGILVPVKDYKALAAGIVKLLKDNKLRIKYGRAGKKRIEAHFQLKDMVKKYEDVYYSLAEK